MTIRVWALWNRSRNIGIFLVVLSIVDCSAGIVTFVLYGPTRSPSCMSIMNVIDLIITDLCVVPDSLSSNFPGCIPIVAATTLDWYFVAVVVHQTGKFPILLLSYMMICNHQQVIFALTAIKGVQHCTSQNTT